MTRARRVDGGGYVLGRISALHRSRIQNDADHRCAAIERGEYVAQRGGLQRCDQPDGFRKRRQGAFPRRVEHALG